MKQQWLLLNDKFMALSSREKWLILLCGAVGFFFVFLTFLVEPSLQDYNNSKNQLRQIKQNNQLAESELMVLTAKLSKDPDQEIDKEYQSLIVQSQELSLQLSEIIESLVAPTQMSHLLESVLVSGKDLKLISLESLNAEPIVKNNDQSEGHYSGYFVHPVRIELTGNYFAIEKYLNALENLPVKYYWRHFNYSVEKYPEARLILEVYTLGTRQEFIGG
ncbi:MSHA biogenesis protein MshJ [Vibrio genomosp. F6 str. FF-238]|uniref:MSHA biogenesis protein MshJ n=2 Tax=Vibrio TaxID=662 RepID=A0A1E5D8A2_9VIBR|nr:MSHA biogenesis protein MshJ [Vibrio genomosp. F6 str. FF-238]